MYTLSKHASINRATPMMSSCHIENQSRESWHHIEVLETGSHTYHTNPAMQGTQTQGSSCLLRHPAGTMYRIFLVLAHEASIQCPWAACGSPF